ncbi:hypothetical protein [Sediminicurvatus halobius]|uniref:Uncharacterized protein n=1 Tax=Sediminicurvatus halobius TaxID=2182432 RepID=A0A2U2MXU7_9GAMM|nr:hypothetical protein [Spiribacter halobius]PWG61776.1 hypothetical protein DEM34_15025 [Spiribacter halobius]UEX76789.1 hypothetical protein LMH63_12575 [Spiribacter halobius]
MSLVIGGIELPLYAGLELSQTYSVIGGRSDFRLADGAAIRQRHWQRLRTEISGSGWMPPGLVALDYDQPVTILCITQRSLVTTGLTVTLPAARRTDAGYTPLAWAWTGGGYEPAALAISGDEATITAVTGAEHYRVDYWPALQCICNEPQESGDVRDFSYQWTLTAEET